MQEMQEIEEFSLFQFDVDNASTIERSVSLLLSKLPTHPSWVLNYVYQSPQSTITRDFIYAFINLATVEDIPRLKDFLTASAVPFIRHFDAAPEIANALIEWYQHEEHEEPHEEHEEPQEQWQSFIQGE